MSSLPVASGCLKISYFNYGAESALHLPAVVGRHPSGIWYSLLLETGRPGIQLIQRGREGRPILTWRIMGGGLKVTHTNQSPSSRSKHGCMYCTIDRAKKVLSLKVFIGIFVARYSALKCLCV